MKRLLQAEELLFFLVSIYALYLLEVNWWYYLLLFIGPDVSMIGYLAGNKFGAVLYNLFHHKAIAIIFLATGLYLSDELIIVIGIILFGHSSMDRMFGYGLKHFKGFKFTHLGIIESTKKNNSNI